MESERRLKRKKRKKRRIIILIMVIAICFSGYFAVNNQFVKGIYYKVNEPVSDKNPVLESEEGNHADYRVFDNFIISASKNGICSYNLSLDKVNTNHFEELSSLVAGYNDMKIKTGKNNIAVYDKSGREIVVFNNRRIINNIKLNSSILLAKPLEGGGVVVLAEDISARNQIIVYNNAGKEEFIWHSGVNNILDAAYIEDEGLLAVAAADLSTGILNSKVMFFDISSANPKSEILIEDTLITNLEFFGKTLVGISDKGIYYISEDGEIKKTYSYNEKMLSHFNITDEDNIVLTFNGSGHESVTEVVNKKGVCIGNYTSNEEIIYIDSFNGNIMLCSKRNINIISKKGFLLRNISFSKDLNKGFFIGKSKILVIGNSEIRVIN